LHDALPISQSGNTPLCTQWSCGWTYRYWYYWPRYCAKQLADQRADLQAKHRAREHVEHLADRWIRYCTPSRTSCGFPQWRTGLFSALRLALPTLAYGVSSLALCTISGLCRRAGPVAQSGRWVHLHARLVARLLCFIGDDTHYREVTR